MRRLETLNNKKMVKEDTDLAKADSRKESGKALQ